MTTNLILNLDSFQWTNISEDRSACIDNLAILHEVLIDYEDSYWHHPDIYSLAFDWGHLYSFCLSIDYVQAKESAGNWFKKRHFDTLRKLFQKCKHQSEPVCRSLEDMNNHVGFTAMINGLFSCEEGNNDVFDLSSRNELVIRCCANNNSLISWGKTNFFLPNLDYSNRHLAEILEVDFDTDFRLQKEQVDRLAKQYCDTAGGERKGQSKEAMALEVGREIARRNFYIPEIELSSREQQRCKSLRSIFSLNKENRKLYISIDFEKGYCYEVCNERGQHIGEFRFDGLENGRAGSTIDKSGRHDIKLD